MFCKYILRLQSNIVSPFVNGDFIHQRNVDFTLAYLYRITYFFLLGFAIRFGRLLYTHVYVSDSENKHFMHLLVV